MIETLTALLDAHRKLIERWRSLPSGQLTNPSDIKAANMTFPQEQRDIAERTEALFDEAGPVTDWLLSALRGERGDDALAFALDALTHGTRLPHVFLQAYVTAATSLGRGGGEYIERAAVSHGRIAVLNAMIVAAEAGVLGYEARRFLTYYVHARSDIVEPKSEVRAAYRRLQDITFKAADAPPGARRAGEPRESD